MAKIYIETYGCALNQSDSELMAGMIALEGHKIVDSFENSDLVIINTCTVKNSAETKLFRALKKYSDKKIIISGCIPQGEQSLLNNEFKDYSVVGTKQMVNIPFVIDETLKGNKVQIVERTDNQRLNLPKIRQNDKVEIIPINEGCLGSCTYCKTKHARGHVKSYAESDIISQAKNAVSEGVSQIWITSQDSGAYGADTDTNFIELLNKLCDIDGDFKIRLGMINPNHAREYLTELCDVLNNDKMFKFIHIPIQSASDNVLKEMNRKYNYDDYKLIVNTLRKNVKGVRISTDIIVGFPTESDEDFEKTYNYVKEIKPEVTNISRYWKRPNTPAASMKPLQTKVVKERSIRIVDLFKDVSIAEKEGYVGKTLEVFGEEIKNSQNFGRTSNYISVVCDIKPGETKLVKIRGCDAWTLFG